MARAVWDGVQENPAPVDADKTEELERPPAEAAAAPPAHAPAMRRPVDRWSTVFTVFAAVALVALLLLGAAVISSQQIAVPSASPSPSASPRSSPSTSPTPVPRTPAPTEAQPSPTPAPTGHTGSKRAAVGAGESVTAAYALS